MVIRKTDRVSTVLKHDESLIEVFVSLSPAFERLRHGSLRRVMSRLVTVEQAARMAGVDADELVDRLNDSDGKPYRGAERADTSGASVTMEAVPADLAGLAEDLIVDVDVRESLRRGEEPFSRIMAARREMPPGGALRVRAIFEPVPLYAAMGKQGLAHHTEKLGEEDWRVWFFAGDVGPASASDQDPGESGERCSADEEVGDSRHQEQAPAASASEGVVVLDVRGLGPPEPMVRTLEALETLPEDATLVQINVRVPQFLLPMLDQRGFEYEIREQEPELVRVFIRRAAYP